MGGNEVRQRIIDVVVRPRRSLGSHCGAVALTFDDGPHPLVTRQILDILTFYEVSATFFVVGERVRENGDLIQLLHES